MPTSLEVALQGLRDAGEGLRQFGENRRERKKRDEKEEAEKVRQQRLQDIGLELDQLAEDAQSSDFNREKYLERSAPVRRKIVESGEMSALGALADIRGGIDAKEREAKEAAKTAKTEKTEATKAGAALTAEQRANRSEEDKVVDDYSKHKVTIKTGEVREAREKIRDLASKEPSAQRDMAIITSWAKSLDPVTGVKEAEFRTAAEAKAWFEDNFSENPDGTVTSSTGWPMPSGLSKFFQNLNPSKKGAILLPGQRQGFVDASEDIYEGQLKRQKEVDVNYGGRLKRVPGADLSRISDSDVELNRISESKKAKADKKKKDDDLKLNPEGGGAPNAKVMDQATFQKFYDDNKPMVEAAFAAANQRRAAAGQPPLTPQEKQAQVQALIRANNVQTAPRK